jgi:fido (protein-threonine AMPylation protein)
MTTLSDKYTADIVVVEGDRQARLHLETIASAIKRVRGVDASETTSTFRLMYLHDIWYGENVCVGDTGDTIEMCCLLEESTAASMAKFNALATKKQLDPTRTALKLTNLKTAINALFDSESAISIESICRLHAMLMRDLLPAEQCGTFRANMTTAVGSNYLYALPKNIDNRLRRLLAFYDATRPQADTPLKQFALASLFMSEFLLIHPFTNGNGRTARLLLSLILRDATLVPFAFSTTSRGDYIATLEKREPGRFCLFVLQQAFYFVTNMENVFCD